jgi:2,3-bisphosphoglycerate-independent phosphoglycerate mutase
MRRRCLVLKKNQPHTAHTTNDVIFILACDDYKSAKLSAVGGLKDIAPTILGILSVKKPSDMTGKSLIEVAK